MERATAAEGNFSDEPPNCAELTDYDREHARLYLRLIDAAADGADWREVVSALFELDPAREPERARRVYDSHLTRAQWMTSQGYPLLLREGKRR
jgi:hypothetical protein